MLWNEGNISELLLEGKIIQQKLTSPSRSKKESLAKAFGKLMKRGKVKAAMRLLSSSEASILSVHDKVSTTNIEGTRTVLDELKAKHPFGMKSTLMLCCLNLRETFTL